MDGDPEAAFYKGLPDDAAGLGPESKIFEIARMDPGEVEDVGGGAWRAASIGGGEI